MSPTVKLDPALKNVVFLDVETQFLADEVGGWDKKELMKVSVAVTYNTREKQYRQYTEATVPRLLDELFAADLVVGFNTLGFDYAVLQPYGLRPLAGLPSLDLLAEIKKTLGFRLKLDSLAQATLKAEKSADGLQAVAWFREGKLEQLLSYCQKDVEITHRLWAFGREFGYLLFEDRDKGLLRVSADW
jgi:DEAD/DEAH box helicase domain-containing protein